jgi:hypothetical protein
MIPSKLNILKKGTPTVRPLANLVPLKGLAVPRRNFTREVS